MTINETRSEHWPFGPGDRVTCRGNWGVLTDPIRTDSERHPGKVYTVHEIADGGRWISLRDDEGHLFCHGRIIGASIGPSYFKLAGECHKHFPTFRSDFPYGDNPRWECARCDAPTEPRQRGDGR